MTIQKSTSSIQIFSTLFLMPESGKLILRKISHTLTTQAQHTAQFSARSRAIKAKKYYYLKNY